MANDGQVHWHEGMFLQPHQLQVQQRHLMANYGLERKLTLTYPYGVVEAHLNTSALRNKRVEFERLRVVMPSGLVVDYPGQAELSPLDIKQIFDSTPGSFTVYLGVPRWDPARPNAIDPSKEDVRLKRPFLVREVELNDENSGDNPKPVLVRRVNARLMLDKDDAVDMEKIPVLRVIRATQDDVGFPDADPEFVPPCLVASGSDTLRRLVKKVANDVAATRRDLARSMANFKVDVMQGKQIWNLMRLQALNRGAGVLPALAEAPNVSPFVLYLHMRDVLGSLAALHPDRDPFEAPAYDHDAPAMAFKELVNKIEALLKEQIKSLVVKVPFKKENGVYLAELGAEHFKRGKDFYLCIETKTMDAKAVTKLVEDADEFKVMPKEDVGELWRGIGITEERPAPQGVPVDVHLHYYRLLRGENEKIWKAIVAQHGLGVEWPNARLSDFKLDLYISVPTE